MLLTEFAVAMAALGAADPSSAELAADERALEGYLGARIFSQALEELGHDITTEALVDQLEAMGNIDIGADAPFGFTPQNHQAAGRVWAEALDAACELAPLPPEDPPWASFN